MINLSRNIIATSLLFVLFYTQLNFGTILGFTQLNHLDASRKSIKTSIKLANNWFGFGEKGKVDAANEGNDSSSSIRIINTQQQDDLNTGWLSNNLPSFGEVGKIAESAADIVIVGGGVSGLAAAITIAETLKDKGEEDRKIVLLEANNKCGGRVSSEITQDGFVLDEGFAVFIEEYPAVKKLLDYNALRLKKFLPGAYVKLEGRDTLARVSDPLRNPLDIVDSVLSPIGSIVDKIKVLPLVLNVRLSTVESIFNEDETDTKSALINRWGFSDNFINAFLKPFLEGIYLSSLDSQSSRMFSFIFKMFSDGSATLPAGGMIAVSQQLIDKAESLGVSILTSTPVSRITKKGDGNFLVECQKKGFESSSVVVATDGQIAKNIISNVKGFESLKGITDQPQLSVGCLYYSFLGKAPVQEPILVLNGMTADKNAEPVNNVCFPSVVNVGYAPEGYNLCSVTVLSEAMDLYKNRPNELDIAVRRQLGSWFVDEKNDIMDKWELKKIFYIPKAQPSQYNGPFPASFNGSRSSTNFYGKELPNGLFVCGDHMATATLNGAVESGVKAGIDVAKMTLAAMN